jgi:uncharacterized protein YuzE
MRFEYFAETDTLYIRLKDEPGVDAREVAPNVVLDFNESGEVIGIKLEHASGRTDLQNFQMTSLPKGVAAWLIAPLMAGVPSVSGGQTNVSVRAGRAMRPSSISFASVLPASRMAA